MDDLRLQQFSRHILLDEIGVEGQQTLFQAHVGLVGAGGLGCPAALYLTASGIGRLTLIDSDTVDLTNLQRQILHRRERIGWLKTDSALASLADVSDLTQVIARPVRLDTENVTDVLQGADMVLDCSDNFPTRYLVNRYCHEHRIPLISGSAMRFQGQIASFDFRHAGGACYACLFPDGEDVDDNRCALMGVFAPLTGIIGAMMAAEALKMLIGMGPRPTVQRLMRYETLSANWKSTSFGPDPHCPTCGQPASTTSHEGT